MNHSNQRDPGSVQHRPADLAKPAQGGSSSAPFATAERKSESKPMVGNVAEPMVPKAPLIDLRSDKGDRRVNPQRRAS